MTIEVVAVTAKGGAVTEPKLLAAAETVHRQLRPQMPADYVTQLEGWFPGRQG